MSGSETERAIQEIGHSGMNVGEELKHIIVAGGGHINQSASMAYVI